MYRHHHKKHNSLRWLIRVINIFSRPHYREEIAALSASFFSCPLLNINKFGLKFNSKFVNGCKWGCVVCHHHHSMSVQQIHVLWGPNNQPPPLSLFAVCNLLLNRPWVWMTASGLCTRQRTNQQPRWSNTRSASISAKRLASQPTKAQTPPSTMVSMFPL